ncbi:hypothetical protein VN97_g12853 [Penicillium thymicola]|uniref:HAT C-terminal dimerisation domain-containing protein n=1 Tax=Penicillium thymicola TaxID=293382 RepID=A0AAI9X1P4_PENTH|nr:hypothetical protein VN97_g12853 [Penicillium thymicola]
MSQPSGAYTSSSFDTTDGLPLDALQYLLPDDSLSQRDSQSQLLSESQLDSVPDLPDYRSCVAYQAPSTLPRIKPDRINEFIVCAPEMTAEFVKWWLDTGYGKSKRINWDGNLTNRRAECWKGFQQVANAKDGKPGVMCNKCCTVLTHPATNHTGTSSMQKHLDGPRCRKQLPKKGASSIRQLLSDAAEKRPAPTFTQQVWEQMLLDLITTSNLPFLFVEHQKFRDLFSFARLAPEPPSFPSRKVIRERLRGFVLQYQQETLQTLPSGAKLSLALDCWTSPFQDAFMAITGYFLDKEWEYREVLLGFEPLSGTHSGVNLGKIVLQILQKHQITDRVLAVTTDNASNNKTLITAINDSIHELQLKTDSTIIQVPCLAHVIQLSLVELLGKIKASPKNDNTELEWSEDRVRSLRARQQKRDITDTLNKVRGLAVFINGSPQRKEAFLKLESNGQKLIPIQDVRTRWNSTFLMLRRAKRLSTTFDEYCSLYHQPHFALNAEGWRQIDYLLHILQPFFTYTTLVCQTNDSSIHLIFSIYNRLFDHLERSMHQLRRKRVAWKQLMLSSLEAAKDKLSKYYSMTDLVEGDLYAIGTILDPSNKMEFFSTSDWAPDDTGKDYTKEYRQSLQSLFEKYRLRTPSNISPSDGISFPAKSALERILKDNSSQRSTSPYQDELTKYLQSATVNESAQVFWRNHEREFPILASITRDVMSIPATGAGVERLFNSARDICHYRRGSLSPETIRDIMLYMCTTRFDTKEEQRQVLQEYLSEQEIAASSEELHIGTHCAEAISDTEEDMEMHLHTPAIAPLSAVAAGKRPAINSDDEEDSDADDITDLEGTSALPLPDTQQRVSGRMRKRSRLLDGYIV